MVILMGFFSCAAVKARTGNLLIVEFESGCCPCKWNFFPWPDALRTCGRCVTSLEVIRTVLAWLAGFILRHWHNIVLFYCCVSYLAPKCLTLSIVLDCLCVRDFIMSELHLQNLEDVIWFLPECGGGRYLFWVCLTRCWNVTNSLWYGCARIVWQWWNKEMCLIVLSAPCGLRFYNNNNNNM